MLPNLHARSQHSFSVSRIHTLNAHHTHLTWQTPPNSPPSLTRTVCIHVPTCVRHSQRSHREQPAVAVARTHGTVMLVRAKSTRARFAHMQQHRCVCKRSQLCCDEQSSRENAQSGRHSIQSSGRGTLDERVMSTSHCDGEQQMRMHVCAFADLCMCKRAGRVHIQTHECKVKVCHRVRACCAF